MPVTEQQITLWEKVANAATLEPWSVEKDGAFVTAIGPCVAKQYAGQAWIDIPEQDAAFIAAARKAIPALIADLREAQSELEEWRFTNKIDELCRRVDLAEAKLAEAEMYKPDAKRYRWLQKTYVVGNGYLSIDEALLYGDADTELTPAIDAAIAAQEKP